MIWKDITGYEGIYQICEDGRVKSLAREKRNRVGVFITKELIKKQQLDTDGYLRVPLTKCGKMTTRLVHRLLSEAFIPNPHNYPQVNHIDGNKINNSLNNLEWCNNSMNQLHAVRTGLRKHPNGERIHNSRLTAEKVMEIRKSSMTVRKLALLYGVSPSAITHARLRLTWMHIQ